MHWLYSISAHLRSAYQCFACLQAGCTPARLKESATKFVFSMLLKCNPSISTCLTSEAVEGLQLSQENPDLTFPEVQDSTLMQCQTLRTKTLKVNLKVSVFPEGRSLGRIGDQSRSMGSRSRITRVMPCGPLTFAISKQCKTYSNRSEAPHDPSCRLKDCCFVNVCSSISTNGFIIQGLDPLSALKDSIGMSLCQGE